MQTLILGCGYSGTRIARALACKGQVVGTRREQAGVDEIVRDGIEGVQLDGEVSDTLRKTLLSTTHLISSVAPARELPLRDPMLDVIAPLAEQGALPSLVWIGYLSTIGVYGDHAGRWIDEDTPCTSRQTRSLARVEAEAAWQALGERQGVPVAVLRLSGIYGPGRNAVQDAVVGRARMLIKSDQVFNRIHVDDLASAMARAADQCCGEVLNISDDRPAPPQDVIRFAHGLVGRSAPPATAFESAELSPMARSFYSENKRVCNARSKSVLGLQYCYADYRSGLSDLADQTIIDAQRRSSR